MSEVKPALTAEEWARMYAERWDEGSDHGVFQDGSRADRGWTVSRMSGQVFIGAGAKGPPCIIGVVPTADHALAAFCLHEQIFGFTREMAGIVRWAAEIASSMSREPHKDADPERWKRNCQNHKALLRETADRIEALLPPETP